MAGGSGATSNVIEHAATGAHESAAMGNISPQALRSAAVTGRRAGYATGSGPFDDLARAGSAVMSPLPNSGTAGRLNALELLGGGYAVGGIPGAAVGLAGSVARPAIRAVASRALMSRPVQSYLKNQVLPRSTAAPMSLGALASFLASRGNAIGAARLNNR